MDYAEKMNRWNGLCTQHEGMMNQFLSGAKALRLRSIEEEMDRLDGELTLLEAKGESHD